MVQKPHEGSCVKYILAVAVLFFSGCSNKATTLFEDLFAENKVIKAEGQFKGTVGKDPRTPILSTKSSAKTTQHYSNQENKPNSFRGKIASVHFDRDFNLYLYTFIDNLTHKPVIFYYDKNIQRKHYSGDYRIVVNGNYLISYREIKTTDQKGNSATDTSDTKKHYIIRTKYKKRKRSSIKVPIEEKINPL